MTRNQIIRLLRITLVLLVALIVIGYAFFRSMDYIKGPEIIISSPINGTTVQDTGVLIEGYALRVSDIWLNNRPITLSEEGYFEEDILLNPGYNNITLKVKDKFGRYDITSLEIIRK